MDLSRAKSQGINGDAGCRNSAAVPEEINWRLNSSNGRVRGSKVNWYAVQDGERVAAGNRCEQQQVELQLLPNRAEGNVGSFPCNVRTYLNSYWGR